MLNVSKQSRCQTSLSNWFSSLLFHKNSYHCIWSITINSGGSRISQGAAPTSSVGGQPIIWPKFFQNLHKIIWNQFGSRVPGAPPPPHPPKSTSEQSFGSLNLYIFSFEPLCVKIQMKVRMHLWIGGRGGVPTSSGFNLLHCHAAFGTIWPNNMLAPQPWKSWIILNVLESRL